MIERRYLTVKEYSAITKMPPQYYYNKIRVGTWEEDREYLRLNDGHIIVDTKAVKEARQMQYTPQNTGRVVRFN